MKRIGAVLLVFFAIFLLIAISVGIAFLFRENAGGGRLSRGGVAVSADGGRAWEMRVRIDDKKTIGGVSVLALAQHPSEEMVWYLGSRGNGAFRTSTKGRKWEQVLAGGTFPPRADVWDFVFDPSAEGTLYAALHKSGRGALIKSDDNGETFREVFLTARDVPIYTIALDPTAPSAVYIGTGDGGIIKSDDGGVSWKRLATLDAAVFAIYINPRDPREIYALLVKKGIMRSRDRGATWESLRQSLRSFRGAQKGNMLLMDRANPRHLYYASSYGLIESFDDGETWRDMPFVEAPQRVPILSLAQDSHIPPTLYVSAGTLLYRSSNGGKSWSITGLRAPSPVVKIVVNAYNAQEVFVGLRK